MCGLPIRLTMTPFHMRILSDFFFVWLKRALADAPLLRDSLTPKESEIVQDETKSFEGRTKDRSFFEKRMALAFRRRPARPPERWHRFGRIRTQDHGRVGSASVGNGERGMDHNGFLAHSD